MIEYEESIAQARSNNNEDCCACTAKTKAPIQGVTPYWIVGVNRVNDLLAAIGRYVNDTPMTRDNLSYAQKWAQELKEQIDLMDTMLIYE